MNKKYKINEYLYRLRTALGISQQEVADKLFVSAKTVSNWERNRNRISHEQVRNFVKAFNLDSSAFFDEFENAYLSNINPIFYRCQNCGNFIHSFAPVSCRCCSKKMSSLSSVYADEEHSLFIEELPTNELLITSRHPANDDHTIEYVAYALENSVSIYKIPRGQSVQLRIPMLYSGKIYALCNKHGLMHHIIE